jgi:predicted phage terminase large subunit-like protein
MKTIDVISPEEYDAILRNDLMTFAERCFAELNPQTKFLRASYLQIIASKLEECRQGKCKRLIINLPPRSLKSILASVAFPAYLLGRDPSLQIITASYGQDLADKLARDSRNLMESPFYRRIFPGTLLSPQKRSVNEFLTTKNGFRMSTSVGGVLTGRGADIIIIDDPLKPDEALSESRRKAVNDWYDNTLQSRLNSKEDGVIIIVMQRLHQDDLIGHVQEQGKWEVLSFPAFAEEDESFTVDTILGSLAYRRSKGDVLHPERESAAILRVIRQTMGEYHFVSQYQQNPMPLEGNIVKRAWLRFYSAAERPTRFSYVIQSWDTACKSGELNNYSVGTTWGYLNGYYYLLDVRRARVNYPDLKRMVISYAKEYAKYHPTVLIEDKASGTQLIQELKQDGGGFSVKGYEPGPGSDKVMRLVAQTALIESGKVLFPSEAPWLEEYLKELTSFPGSKYSDQVDSTTQALDYLTTSGRVMLQWAAMAG